MRRTVLVFGLIAGAILSVMMVLTMPFMERIGFDKGAIIGYTTMVLAFLMVWFGVRSYRDTVAGGTVTFGRALVVALLITAVASACYVVTWQVLSTQFLPDFHVRYADYARQQLVASGASAEELAAQAKQMAEYAALARNPLANMAITFLEPLPVGVLFSVVSAFVHSRRRGAAPARANSAAAAG